MKTNIIKELEDSRSVFKAICSISSMDADIQFQFKKIESLIELGIKNDSVRALIESDWKERSLIDDKQFEIHYIETGYSYVKINYESDHTQIGNQCDCCASIMTKTGYLIYVLGRVFCEDCFDNWKAKAIKYEEDIITQEKQHRDYYEHYLD